MVIRPEEQWHLKPSDRGRAVHELIGELLSTSRTPTLRAIHDAVACHQLVVGKAVIHRQAVKQHLATAVSLYFSRFVPAELWDLAGVSVRVDGCEFDLLWRDSRNGSILADELKTGVHGLRFGRMSLEEQVGRQLRVGKAVIGGRFVGVRAIVLAQPWRSFLARPDGSRESLQWEVI